MMSKPRTTFCLVLPGLALVSLVAACGESSGSSRTTLAAMVQDHQEIEDLEQDLEGSVEEPLSGAVVAAASNDADLDVTVNAAIDRAQTYFRPSGCLSSERAGMVVTHEFSGCTGPRGHTIDGTVVSTWTLENGRLSVVHDAMALEIDGAVVDHSTAIDYQRSATGLSGTRTSSTVGQTNSGRAIDHTAQFEFTLDAERSCLTRAGEATVTIGDHTWSRTVTDWEACGGRFACPSAGTIEMTGPGGEGRVEITEQGVYDLMFNGRTDSDRRMPWCGLSSEEQ